MESMTIHLVSVVECNGQVVARARAEADQARIHIEVRFTPPPGGIKGGALAAGAG